MNNVQLMKKVIELDTQTLNTREQSQRVMIQIAIIRKAYGVKNNETNDKVLNFERERVLSDKEIEKEFKQYVGFWEWAINTNNLDKAKSFENQVNYFIDGVRFFDEKLAQNFKESFLESLYEVSKYEELEKKHLGNAEKKTGIYHTDILKNII